MPTLTEGEMEAKLEEILKKRYGSFIVYVGSDPKFPSVYDFVKHLGELGPDKGMNLLKDKIFPSIFVEPEEMDQLAKELLAVL